jgi:hypothetical protein
VFLFVSTENVGLKKEAKKRVSFFSKNQKAISDEICPRRRAGDLTRTAEPTDKFLGTLTLPLHIDGTALSSRS